MSGKIEISRELLERWQKTALQWGIDSIGVEIMHVLAAPVVERRPVAIVRHIVTETGERYEGVIRASAILEGIVESGTKLYASLPAPVSVVTREQVEIVAESIYWQWAGREGFVPWIKGGNSLKQDEARSIAWKTLDKVKELNQ